MNGSVTDVDKVNSNIIHIIYGKTKWGTGITLVTPTHRVQSTHTFYCTVLSLNMFYIYTNCGTEGILS